jgi:cytochrome c
MGAVMFGGSGFSYSAAVKSKANGNWDYGKMGDWLADPSSFAPGTAMSYSGIKNPQTRADAVAYLRSLAATPIPLPTPAQVKAASAPAPSAAAGTPAAGTPAPGGAPAAPSIDTMFATADVSKGEALVQQQCSSCHTLNKGGAAGVGPNLYGLLGSKMFGGSSFSYSAAVEAKANGTWNADNLSDWLKDPNGFAAGTAMAYPGIKKDQTRADVIAYLNKDSDSPIKLPGAK